jgi:glucose/arabinose dehydrogenase
MPLLRSILALVLLLFLAAAFALLAAAEDKPLVFPTPVPQPPPFALQVVADGLSSPVYAIAPKGDPRLFVVEQTGTIRILKDGSLSETPFLDVTSLTRAGGERGLLGLAFHPDYASNGRFFVNYTDTKGDTQVAAYKVSSDPDVADPATAQILFSVDQPASNHNGGWLGFGPDGLLYIAMGDGGGAGDPRNNAQNPKSLLGKILRFDVEGGSAPEIFVSGVRNPWRNAWDGDNFYIADVGQSQWEEVNVITTADAGRNLGWRRVEGVVCYDEINCDSTDFIKPILVYSHELGCSITGGFVYRGAEIPALTGRYLYADYCAGILHSVIYADGQAKDHERYDALGPVGDVTSFGQDSSGELYVMTGNGTLSKLVPAQ